MNWDAAWVIVEIDVEIYIVQLKKHFRMETLALMTGVENKSKMKRNFLLFSLKQHNGSMKNKTLPRSGFVICIYYYRLVISD